MQAENQQTHAPPGQNAATAPEENSSFVTREFDGLSKRDIGTFYLDDELMPAKRYFQELAAKSGVDADDVYQVAARRLYEWELEHGRARHPVKVLQTMGRTIFLDMVRPLSRRAESLDDPEVGSKLASDDIESMPHERACRELLVEEFELALQDLCPDQRKAFILVKIEGFTHVEVAEMMGASVKSIGSRVVRAREALRRNRRLVELRQAQSSDDVLAKLL